MSDFRVCTRIDPPHSRHDLPRRDATVANTYGVESDMREVVIAHFDEIALKRGRRPYYEKRLVTGIENSVPRSRASRDQGSFRPRDRFGRQNRNTRRRPPGPPQPGLRSPLPPPGVAHRDRSREAPRGDRSRPRRAGRTSRSFGVRVRGRQKSDLEAGPRSRSPPSSGRSSSSRTGLGGRPDSPGPLDRRRLHGRRGARLGPPGRGPGRSPDRDDRTRGRPRLGRDRLARRGLAHDGPRAQALDSPLPLGARSRAPESQAKVRDLALWRSPATSRRSSIACIPFARAPARSSSRRRRPATA